MWFDFVLFQLAYGEMKNEIRPTKKDLDKRISEMQEKHGETFGSLKIFQIYALGFVSFFSQN